MLSRWCDGCESADFWKSMRLEGYFYVPKSKELPYLFLNVRCVGGRPFATGITEGGWSIVCENDRDHIRVVGKTYEEAVENYRKQRGK